MKKFFEVLKTLLIFIVILFIIFFSIVNSEIIKVNFDFFPFNFVLEIRVFLLIIFSFCIGFLFGIAATSYSLMIKFFENIKNKRKAEKLEKQIKNINSTNNSTSKENE